MALSPNDIESIVSELHHLKLLINNIDEPLWLVDAQCNILECNSSFKRWVKHFTGKELEKGDHVLDHGKHKLYTEKFEMCYQLALGGRSFTTVEDMLIDGRLHYTSINFNPLFGENDAIDGVSCFARDITDLRKHLHRIEEQNMALREIAFIESHRVRAPLANILGLEQFFNYENAADPINGELMQHIAKQSLELDKIIKEVVAKSNEIGLQS